MHVILCKMMDLKEIIRWFIPCFHLLVAGKRKMDVQLTLFILFLFFNSMCAANANSLGVSENSLVRNKYVGSLDKYEMNTNFNQSEVFEDKLVNGQSRHFGDTSIGRTFGRPFKKMIAGLIPVIFQIGAASTWAVVAALVGVKTLLVTMVILKLLLLAGAAKVGALFASKGHNTHGWEKEHSPQKEIHLHIHNGHPEHHEHQEYAPITTWNREGVQAIPAAVGVQDVKTINYPINYVIDPYRGGPQTISTPFGHYMKVDVAADVNRT